MTEVKRFADHLAEVEARGFPCPVEELQEHGLADLDFDAAYAVQAASAELMGKSAQAWKIGKSPQGVPAAAPILDLYQEGDEIVFGAGTKRVQAIEVEICYPLISVPPVGADVTRQDVEACIGKPHLGVELIGFRLTERNKAPFPLFLADRLGNHSFLLAQELPADIATRLPGIIPELSLTITTNGKQLHSAPAVHPATDPVAPLLAYLRHGAPGGPLEAGQIVTTGSLCGVVDVEAAGDIDIRLDDIRLQLRLI